MALTWPKPERKEKSSAANEGAKKVPRAAAYLITAIVGAALAGLAGFVAIAWSWQEHEERLLVRQLESFSASMVHELLNRSAAVQGHLREWSSDPELRKAFLAEQSDADELKHWESVLVEDIPGALGVELIRPQVLFTDQANDLKLSFAGMDLIRFAVREKSLSPLEVHRVGQPEEHLAMTGPVMDAQGKDVIGVIHVSLPLSLLPYVSSSSDSWGHFGFQQRAMEEFISINPQRGEPLPSSTPDYTKDIPGTRLRVAAWATGEGLVDPGHLTRLATIYGIYLLATVLALWLPYRRMSQALAIDLAGILALVEDATNRRPVRPLRSRLAETAPVQEMIRNLLRSFQAQHRLRDTESLAASGFARTPSAQTPGRAPPSSAVELADLEALADAREGPRPSPGGTPAGSPAPAKPRAKEGAIDSLDEDFLDELADGAAPRAAAADDSGQAPNITPLPAQIFRAYDVRGIVGRDLTEGVCRTMGQAIGSDLYDRSEPFIFVARDARPSGDRLSVALVDGLHLSGCNVIDLGVVPTPLLYFAAHYEGEASGVVVTGSHNPIEYNGLKLVYSGRSASPEQYQAIRSRVAKGTLITGPNNDYVERDITRDYIEYVERNVTLARRMKVVVDCGNAAASRVAPGLYRALGCDVVELNCELGADLTQGAIPDPAKPENLRPLADTVLAEQADLGVAFDGDGDRLGVVDSAGRVIPADRLMMVLAADVLSRHPGTDVVYDVKSSHLLAGEILRNGGRPVMWKSGHTNLKEKLRETGALIAGEWSGHIVFKERWFGFDDALYAGARLLEVLALDPRATTEVFSSLPNAVSTPELSVEVGEDEQQGIVEAVLAIADRLEGVEVITIDGLRAEFERGWGLVRASNTQPAIVFRFEADDDESMAMIKDLFRRLMERAAPSMKLPF